MNSGPGSHYFNLHKAFVDYMLCRLTNHFVSEIPAVSSLLHSHNDLTPLAVEPQQSTEPGAKHNILKQNPRPTDLVSQTRGYLSKAEMRLGGSQKPLFIYERHYGPGIAKYLREVDWSNVKYGSYGARHEG